MNLKLALSGRLFEREYTDNIPMREFAEIASGTGYQGVELRRTQVSLETPGAQVKESAGILKDHGLEVVCMTPRGYPVLDDEDLFIRYLELAGEFECRLVKMGDDGGAPEKTRRCAEIARRHGIRIGLNNHIGTEEKPNCTETIDRTVQHLKRVDHPNFGILFDVCHLFISGSDYGPEAIEKIKDRIFYVLFQYVVETGVEDAELVFHGRGFETAVIGEPNGPDFNKVFEGLKQSDYNGYLGVIAPMRESEAPQETARVYYERIGELFA